MSGLEPLPALLSLTDADRAFQDEFRSWLTEHPPVWPAPAERKARYLFGREWQKALADAGWSGVTWPKEFGGLGANPVQQYIYYEELARAHAPDFPNRPGLILLAPTLMTHGDRKIQQRYLPGMLTADEIWAQGFSEPGAGSDLAAVRCRARFDNGVFRIEGQKIWVTAGDLATHGAILCRTGELDQRHRALTLLLVDLDQSGIEIRPIRTATGETEFSEIFFDGATTPADHAIGGLNHGWAAAMTMLEYERGDWTFTDHRPFFAQLRQIWSDVQARVESDGDSRALADLKERLAAAWVGTHQLREMNIALMFRRAGGAAIGFWGSPVKAFWGQLNQLIQNIALDAGDHSCGISGPQLDRYLTSRMSTVYSGAIDIQRSVVAERLLGLPRAAHKRSVPVTNKSGDAS